MHVLGLDVGGANLKVMHTAGRACTQPFALWKAPQRLVEELKTLLGGCPAFDRIALTMTGELCDCFESKREGVNHILDAVETAARGRPIHVWTNEGRFVDAQRARAEALKVASANWLAQAAVASRRLPSPGPALLIDVGTTTTDLTYLTEEGTPLPRGRTDPERMKSRELVYVGWRRTPLCALLHRSAAELFATTLDVCLALELCQENPNDHDTADGRPATRAAAHRRLARMTCADLETSTHEERLDLAREAYRRQLETIGHAVCRVATRPIDWVIASGSGEFLVPALLNAPALEGRLLSARLISFSDNHPDVSTAACAYAVAVLCQEMTAP